MNDHYDFIERLLPEPGNFEAAFAFSVHKAGSTLMHKMIGEVCSASRIPAVSIPDRMFLEGVSDDWQADERLISLYGEGRVYFGYRNLPPFMSHPRFELSHRRCVLLVRDPRDALVSQYFSLGGKYISHKMPKKNREQFLSRLQRTAHLEIDEYVLQASKGYLAKLTSYAEQLNFDRTLLERYEEIYYDKQSFLQRIFQHFGLEVPPEVITRVAAENDIRPSQEDMTRHIRKGEPGDHRHKLQPETIAQLNETFRSVGGHFGYTL